MAKVICCTRGNGGVDVVFPSGRRLAQLIASGMTEDQALDMIADTATKDDSGGRFKMEDVDLPLGVYSDAWRGRGAAKPVIDMPAARAIHAGRIARAQAAEIARLKVAERSERLKGNTAKADTHAATVTALEALDLNVLAIQIAAAPNATALKAIWPANVPKP